MNKKKIIISISCLLIAIIILSIIFILTNKKEPMTYNVTFETNGGTVINSQTIDEGEKVVKPSDPEKESYIFVQWLYQGQTYDFSSEVKSDLVLTAEWIEKEGEIETFVVNFDSDGGTTIPNQIIEKGNKIQKPENPTKEGYTFKGWFLNDLEYNFDLIEENDLELIAKWEKEEEKKPVSNVSGNSSSNNNNPSNKPITPKPTKKEYTVTFNSDGGSSVASQKIIEGNKATKPENPTKTNKLFNGWFIGENEYDFNNSVTSNLTLVATWVLYGDVNLDGVINAKDVASLNRHLSGNQSLTGVKLMVADVNSDNKIDDLDVAILRKYFGGWFTIFPYPSGETYNISYELNGGVLLTRNYLVYSQISLPYTLNNPKKEGCVFVGWTGSNGTTPQTSVTIPEGTTGNLNYTANWAFYGDISQDNKIDTLDVVMIEQYISGMIEFNQTQKKVADVNLDDLVDEKDRDILVKYISDKEGYGIPKLPHTS